ncbi:hypothetical protein U2G67_000669 [Vibrio parahaemolyticus]|nr:hypothetical protein [Vibrio parahaemolyticus]
MRWIECDQGDASKFIEGLVSKRLDDNLFGYIELWENSDGSQFIIVRLSNGTNSKHEFVTILTLYDDNNNSIDSTTWKQNIGMSLYGSVERSKCFRLSDDDSLIDNFSDGNIEVAWSVEENDPIAVGIRKIVVETIKKLAKDALE